VLQVHRAGICGTELRGYATGHAHAPLPLVMGHEISGVVVGLGEGVDALAPGDRVTVAPLGYCGHCRWCRQGATSLCERPLRPWTATNGGFAERAAVPAHLVFPLPDGLSLDEAALAEPIAVGYHAVRRGELQIGQTALVCGAGPIGLGIVQVAVAAGTSQMLVSELSAGRRQAALALGATRVVDPAAEDPLECVRAATGGLGVDVAFEAGGVQETLDLALAAVRNRGVVVNVAGREGPSTVPLGALLRREIEVRLSFGCDAYEELPVVLDLMARKVVDAGRMVSHHIPLEEIVPRGFEALLADRETHLKVLVDPNSPRPRPRSSTTTPHAEGSASG
jgi:threonine dehydrogenase-like Zn-dependent dehydrogenase